MRIAFLALPEVSFSLAHGHLGLLMPHNPANLQMLCTGVDQDHVHGLRILFSVDDVLRQNPWKHWKGGTCSSYHFCSGALERFRWRKSGDTFPCIQLLCFVVVANALIAAENPLIDLAHAAARVAA